MNKEVRSDGENMKIQVLDKGYVELIDAMGNDLRVANAARASFEKRKETMDEKDEKLIQFLAEHGHNSPLRHCAVTIETRAPLFVARQLWKYHVAAAQTDGQDGWNETSRRYVTEEPEFYIPQWRSAGATKKQGSEDFIENYHLVDDLNDDIRYIIEQGLTLYYKAIDNGVAPEQARCFLPAYAMYIRWYWTMSLQSAFHMVNERTHEGAQWETRQYAKTIAEIIIKEFPVTSSFYINNQGNEKD